MCFVEHNALPFDGKQWVLKQRRPFLRMVLNKLLGIFTLFSAGVYSARTSSYEVSITQYCPKARMAPPVGISFLRAEP